MSIQNIFVLDVDFKRKNYMNEPTVTQNDDVTFILNVYDDEVEYDLTNVTTCTLAILRPDGQSVMTLGTETGANQITFNLGSTELEIVGRVNASIQLYDVNGRVSTLPFTYQVIKDLIQDYIPSANEQTLIELVLGEAPAILDAAELATLDANQATTDANLATHNTNQATADTLLAKQEAEQATLDANTATTNTTTATNETVVAKDNAIIATTNAETATNNLNAILPSVQNLENVESWIGTTQYYKNNIIEHNGSSFMAIVDNLNQSPPTLPAKQNTYWSLMARKGGDGTGILARYRDVFTATENQTIFTLFNSYEQHLNKIDVIVGGVPQYSPDNFTESSSTTITLSTGIPAGVAVIATYFNQT